MNWSLVKLSDICDLFNGYAFKSTDYVEKSNTLSCRMSNIRPGGKFNIEYNARYLPDYFAEKYRQFVLRDNDVVIAMTDLADSPKILGVPTVIKTKGKNILLNQRVGKLVIKEQNEVHFPYLQRALNSSRVRSIYKRYAGGGLQINLGKKDLLSVKIPLPPLAEQQKIAAILDAADSLRQKDQQLIEHYTALSQSLFLEMFGDPVCNPMGWEKVEFGTFINTLTDYHANGSYEVLKENVVLKNTEDYALMVRTTDLEHNNYRENVIHISQDAYDYLAKSKVYGGEIIISKIGSAGKVFLMPYLNRPVSLGMNAFLLRFNENLNNIFVYHLLTSKFGEIEISKRIKGAVTKTIRKDALREIKVIIPPITLQNQFAERIQAIEAQKQQAQASLEKSETLFNSLLQRAFKGELTA